MSQTKYQYSSLFASPTYFKSYFSPRLSLAFKDGFLIRLGQLFTFGDGVLILGFFLPTSLGIFRSCTRFCLTIVVDVFTRYDLGYLDGLITLPVQCMSVT